MIEGNSLMLSLTIDKAVTILAGLAFAFMGYRLFVHGIFGEAGASNPSWENRSLVLKKAAPGTFFALIGTIIVCISLWRGPASRPLQVVSGPAQPSRGVSGFGTDDSQSPTAQKTRPTVLDDIATLNQFATDVLRERTQVKGSRVTVAVEDGDRIVDVIHRAKAALMLSVWSPDWGDREEFRNWAYLAPGYAYGDPPASISNAVAIFKGKAQ